MWTLVSHWEAGRFIGVSFLPRHRLPRHKFGEEPVEPDLALEVSDRLDVSELFRNMDRIEPHGKLLKQDADEHAGMERADG